MSLFFLQQILETRLGCCCSAVADARDAASPGAHPPHNGHQPLLFRSGVGGSPCHYTEEAVTMPDDVPAADVLATGCSGRRMASQTIGAKIPPISGPNQNTLFKAASTGAAMGGTRQKAALRQENYLVRAQEFTITSSEQEPLSEKRYGHAARARPSHGPPTVLHAIRGSVLGENLPRN